MKIAISTHGSNVSEHFGRCPEFTIIDLQDGKVTTRETIENPGHRPGFLPDYLKNQGVDCIIAGGMGMKAKMLFEKSGIDTILGITGNIDKVIEKITKGELEGGESLCEPGRGKGYGIPKEKTQE
ncbi:MAG: NifB/NifX family molybdenum-iron cluster-binding protein [Elusimicrobiota bacterium]